MTRQVLTIKKHKISENDLIIHSMKILNDDFHLSPHTESIYKLLTEYINKDKAFEKRVLKTQKGDIKFSLKKGLFLISSPGVGKSFIFEDLLPHFFRYFPDLGYAQIDVYKLQALYTAHGLNAISEYEAKILTKKNFYNLYVDDFSRESKTVKHFGNELYFIDHFIDWRSRLQKKYGVVTHGTSNLDLAGCKDYYSLATYSRMFAIFNFIIIDAELIDFRFKLT